MPVMELTPAQRRTRDELIGLGRPPGFDPALASAMRARLEDGIAAVGLAQLKGPPIWLGKSRLNDLQRCQGLFQARLLREGPPFEYGDRTASGALFHKAIEVDIATERAADPRSVCDRAALRLAAADAAFERFWSSLDGFGRAEMTADAGRHLVLFRDSFPPLERRWSPQTELILRCRLAGGRVVLSGTPDLVLGRTQRLAIDFKSGGAWPEHPEDMRFYALLILLRTGVPPYRVATFLLDSGEWQPEDVNEETLGRATDRVLAGARAAAALAAGDAPDLAGGWHCGRCPRRLACPAASMEARPVDLRNGVQDELVAGAVGDGSVAVGQTDRP
jgi:hypothetical protein